MLKASPSRTVAVVVGIDHYGYGDTWDLPGPAADALRCADWLLGRGLPPGNIHLYLAEDSKSHPDVATWIAGHQSVAVGSAKRAELVEFLDQGLPAVDADALILFWGGHGVMDDFENHNYLFTADAAPRRPYCMDVQDILRALHGRRFEHISEQVVIVDACANRFSDIREDVGPSPGMLVSGPIYDGIHQFCMFAASPGKFSGNVSERRTGRFTEALFRQLNSHVEAGWPDFAGAFDGAKRELESLGLGEQEPYIVTDTPGRGRSYFGTIPGQSEAVDSLMSILSTQAPPQALIYTLYRRSLPPTASAKGPTTSIEMLLRDLNDFRPQADNRPRPLVEFAERVGRELKRNAVLEWVNDDRRVDPFARDSMRRAFDAQGRKERSRATVFIEVEGVPPNALHWWVHAPDPALCTGLKTLTIDATHDGQLSGRLRKITDEAERAVGHLHDLMIGLILTEQQMFLELESTKVSFDDLGVASAPTPLNRRYTVTLHWRMRAHAKAGGGGKPLNAWRQALDLVVPRIESGGVADVVWLEPRAHEDDPDSHVVAASKLLDEHATEVLVGVGHPADVKAGATPDELLGCLKEGVPCFFWLARPPADAIAARKALCDAFSALRASDAPRQMGVRSRTAKGADPVSLVRIVWDEPGHLPATDAYKGAPLGEGI